MFQLTIHPITPICLAPDTLWTLDAILHGILRDEAMRTSYRADDDRLRDYTGLNCYFGVFAASAAIFDQPVESALTKIGGFRPVRDMHDPRPYSSDRGPTRRMPRIRTGQGQHKAHLSRYILVTAPAVRWFFDGNASTVRDIISRADSLGACKKDGFGRFDPSAMTITELDRDWSFIDPTTNRLLRQIPTRLLEDAPQGSPVETMTWFPPYWKTNHAEPCYRPA